MTSIIRQVTKINAFTKFGLISFLLGMILTSCNNYIKPEPIQVANNKPNDTLFLADAFVFSKLGQELAKLGSSKASEQHLRVYAEKIGLFQEKTEQKWDSLSKKKSIPLNLSLDNAQKSNIAKLSNMNSEKFDQEFIAQIENYLISHIELLENVSTNSEDNDITTFAISLLPNLHEQLENLISVKDKLAVKSP